jgi:hypothetical protein
MVMRISGARVDTGQSLRTPAEPTVYDPVRSFPNWSHIGWLTVSNAGGLDVHPGRPGSLSTASAAVSDRARR